MCEKLRVAVVLEWHPFDVARFHELLWSMDDVEAYVQPWDIFAQDPDTESYDVVLFYNMSFPEPPEGDPRRSYVEQRLGRTEQGIVLLHHAILSYEHWPLWDQVSGTTDRSFTFHQGEELRVRVADPGHPVTEGMDGFVIVDESYAMAEPGPDNDVLLTTTHPRSLRALAWTRRYGNSRVLCYQSGHDSVAWRTPEFRRVLHRGLLWAAHRIG